MVNKTNNPRRTNNSLWSKQDSIHEGKKELIELQGEINESPI